MDTEGLWGRDHHPEYYFPLCLRCSLLLFAFWSDGSHGPPPHPQTPSLLRSPSPPSPSQLTQLSTIPSIIPNVPTEPDANPVQPCGTLPPTYPSLMHEPSNQIAQAIETVPPRPASSGSPTLPTHREPAEAPNLGAKLNRVCELLIGRVAQRLLQNLAAVNACACCLIYKPAGRWHLIQKARRCCWCCCWC
jgi:hypothetical protein